MTMWLLGILAGVLRGKIFPLNASLRSLLPLKGKADGLAIVLVSPLTSLQLGLRGLAVLFFSEGANSSARQKEASLGIPREPFREIFVEKTVPTSGIYLIDRVRNDAIFK